MRNILLLTIIIICMPISLIADSSTKIQFRIASNHKSWAFPKLAKAPDSNKDIYLAREAVFGNSHIEKVTVEDGSEYVKIELDSDGAHRLSEQTAKNQGKMMAIIINGEVVSTPILREKIEGPRVSVNLLSPEKAKELAADLTKAIN